MRPYYSANGKQSSWRLKLGTRIVIELEDVEY